MVNKVILIGRLGKDPDVRHLEGGSTVANFTLATSETYKDKAGNRQELTEWHNIVVWRRQAEIAEQYLHKGSLIYLEGRLRTRSWEDKDGNKRYTTEVEAQTFKMLDRKSDQEPASAPPPPEPERKDVIEENPDDDLPF